jgi:thioredoxin-related protein
MRFVIVGLVVVVSVAVSLQMRRRKPQAPTQPKLNVPVQVDRADFTNPEVPWLVAVFSSASCATCADVVAKAMALASREVSVMDVEYTAHRDLHKRYDIDAVPTVIIADSSGVVQGSFLGPVTATDLWAAVADCRQPGSRPVSTCDNPVVD